MAQNLVFESLQEKWYHYLTSSPSPSSSMVINLCMCVCVVGAMTFATKDSKRFSGDELTIHINILGVKTDPVLKKKKDTCACMLKALLHPHGGYWSTDACFLIIWGGGVTCTCALNSLACS